MSPLRSQSLLFSLAFTVSIMAFATPARATVLEPRDYAFPYTEPYEATLITMILKAGDQFVQEADQLTDLIPDRHDVPYLEGRDLLDYKVSIASPGAPLVFVLAGLGGASDAGISEYIADHLSRQGYSTVSLDSPYYWRFALTASKTGIPGVVTDDARELYGEMRLILKILKAKHGTQPSQLGFVGYSMGGFEGVEIAKIDREEKNLGFKTMMLINPPLDINHGIEALDTLYVQALSLGQETLTGYLGTIINRGEPILAGNIDQPGYFDDLWNRLQLPVAGAKFLISENLESVAPDLVMTSQSIRQTLPSSVLPTPLNEANEDYREAAAQKFLLSAYTKEIVLPSFAARTGLKAGSPEFDSRLAYEMSLTGRFDEIVADPRIHVMHNADDFITASTDLKALARKMPPDRIMVYPYGGHVENIWFPENMKHLLDTFRDGFKIN